MSLLLQEQLKKPQLAGNRESEAEVAARPSRLHVSPTHIHYYKRTFSLYHYILYHFGHCTCVLIMSTVSLAQLLAL